VPVGLFGCLSPFVQLIFAPTVTDIVPTVGLRAGPNAQELCNTLASLMVGSLADLAMVDLLEEGPQRRRVSLVSSDPNVTAQLEFCQVDFERGRISGVASSGEPLLIERVTDDVLVSAAETEQALAALLAIKIRTVMVVPVAGREQIMGILVLARVGSRRRPFGRSDLSRVLGLAQLAGLALDNSGLRERSREQGAERSRIRALQQQSEARLQSVIEHAVDIVISLDRDGFIRYQSEGTRALLGFEPEELVGRHILDVVQSEDLGGLPTLLERTDSQQSLKLRACRIQHKDGSWRTFEAIVMSMANDLAVAGVVIYARDISARMQADAAIRLQGRLLDAVQQAVVATDVDGRVCFWNPFAERLYGWSAAEALGRNRGELLVPVGGLPAGSDILSKVLAGDSWTGEFTVKRRDGTTFPVHVTDSPIFDDQGACVGVIGISFDVTERRRADEAREQLAAIVTSSDDAISAETLDGVITNWNPGAERMYGYTAAEAVGQSIQMLVPDDRIEELTTTLERIRGGQRIEPYETERVRKDGRCIDVSVTVSPLHNGSGEVAAGASIARNITGRVEARRRLRESEQRFRSLFLHHPDAVFALDPAGNYVSANPACERLSGWRAEEFLGEAFGKLCQTDEERATARRHFDLVLRGTPQAFESRVRHRDGHVIDVRLTQLPIVVDGDIVGAYGIAQDITERNGAAELLALRACQQAAVADLGLWALTDAPLSELENATVNLLASVLGLEMSALFKITSDEELLLSAAIGWPSSAIGSTSIRLDPDTLPAYALEHGAPLNITNLGAETRFSIATMLPPGRSAHSGLVGLVPGRDRRAHALLIALTDQTRQLTEDDLSFLQAIANVLGAAIERKHTEEELQHREHEIKQLVENAADCIVRVGPDLRYVYVNAAVERLTGIPASQFIGHTSRELSHDSPALDRWELALQRVFRRGRDETVDVKVETADGARDLQVHLSPELNSDGQVNSVLAIGRDMTEHHQIDAERAQLYRELLERDARVSELVERMLLRRVDTGAGSTVASPQAEQFSKRERQILRLLARGLTNQQIGNELALSLGTVKNYVANMLPRLSAVDRTQAAVRAVELGLLRGDLD
jgi:PAS domain S-box-containing protein